MKQEVLNKQVKQEKEEEVSKEQVKKLFCEAVETSVQKKCCMKLWTSVSKYYNAKIMKKNNIIKKFQRAQMVKAKVFIKL